MLYPGLLENGLIVPILLIGASGAGKSTLARAWPASQVLSLDDLRGVVGDDFPVQSCVASLPPLYATEGLDHGGEPARRARPHAERRPTCT